MAIRKTNIFPIDLQPRNAVGVAYPFSGFGVSGSVPFTSNYTTRDQIKSNLIVYFTTNVGERPLNPNYGGGLKYLIFEQLSNDTLEIVEKTIRDAMSFNFPQVDLKKLEILENADNNELIISLSYTVFNNEEDTLEINFSR